MNDYFNFSNFEAYRLHLHNMGKKKKRRDIRNADVNEYERFTEAQ